MKRRIYLFLVLLISCGVKQPLDVGQDLTTASGSLYITSQPPGASIFLDNILQSSVTPDTLKNIPIGSHNIRVFKKGYFSQVESIQLEVNKDSLHIVSFPLQIIQGASSVFVTSEPTGATIFIDGQKTGLKTPDTVDVQAGQHEISARKNGFESQVWQIDALKDSLHTLSSELNIFQRVLLESFGNVACDPCVKSAENLERFLAEYPDGHYALFEYYANWPAVNDPFYAAAPQDVNERVNYYTAYSLPTLKLNGSTTVDAKNYEQIVANYTNTAAQQNTKLAISLEKTYENNLLEVSVFLYDRAELLNNSNLRLFVAIAEDSLYYENTGGNGLTHFNFVFRGFLTSKKGDAISSAKIDFNTEWPASWNYAHSKIIAFIQDMDTKKIIQTTIN